MRNVEGGGPRPLRGDTLRRLSDLVGPEHITDDRTVSPGSAEEAASVLRLANAERLRVVPAGNFSQQEYWGLPTDADLFLRLSRLSRVQQYEPGDLTAGLEAGLTVAGLSAALGSHRQWLPLGVARPDRATMGGVLAANSSGPFRLFYGTARDVVIGMHFATAEGKLVKSGGAVVKNVAGYDMAKLLIGSLGTLAVITDVNVKVFPRPATETTVLAFRSLAEALEARNALLRSVLSPLAMDLLNAAGAELVGSEDLPPGEFLLAVAYGGVESVIERSRREVAAIGGAVRATALAILAGQDGDGAERRFWDAVSNLPATAAAAHPASIRLKLSSTLQAMRPLLEAVLQPQGIACALVARAGSGISYLHASGERLSEFCRDVQQAALGQGAHSVLEFAPQDIRTQLPDRGPRGDDFPMMQKLKQAFDPNAILSPGRVIC